MSGTSTCITPAPRVPEPQSLCLHVTVRGAATTRSAMQRATSFRSSRSPGPTLFKTRAESSSYRSGMPTEFTDLIPVVVYRDIRAAHDFLVKALGFTSGGLVEDGDGNVIHGEVRA